MTMTVDSEEKHFMLPFLIRDLLIILLELNLM